MVRSTDRPDMTSDVYCGRKTTTQQQQPWFTFVVHSGTAMHRREFVDERYRNRTNTVRNTNGTLANHRDAGFPMVHPGFAV